MFHIAGLTTPFCVVFSHQQSQSVTLRGSTWNYVAGEWTGSFHPGLCLSFLTLEKVLSRSLPSELHRDDMEPEIESIRWLGLLDPFTAVKNLRLSQELVPHVPHALKELDETVTQVLPALQSVKGTSIGSF